MKLIIQIPCYNEEQTLPITLSKLPTHIDGIDEIETLIIDDGSTDNTLAIAKWSGITHIVQQKHLGLAHAFRNGINKAIELGADIIVNTDADNQYNAEDIEKIVRPIIEKKADIVIGARPISSISRFSLLKKLLQKLGSFVVSLVCGLKIDDAPSGFRAFSKDAAMKLNVFDNYTYTMETIIQSKAKGLQILSVPIRVNPDERKSKLVKNIFDYIKRSSFTIIRMFIVYRPFRFFASLASISILVGTLLGFRFLYFYMTGQGNGHIQSLILTSIFIISGIFIGLIAVLADLLAINRKLLEDIQIRVKNLENRN